MSPDRFRELALSLPESTESQNVERRDFCIAGKVFATLFVTGNWGVIKMTSDVQSELLRQEPKSFEACQGAWGRKGATVVFLANSEEGCVLRGLISAWRRFAPKCLLADSIEKEEGETDC